MEMPDTDTAASSYPRPLVSWCQYRSYLSLSATNKAISISKAKETAYKMVCEIQDSATLLEWAMKSAGKEGPLWFDGVVLAHSWCDDPYNGTSETFQIGKRERSLS